MTSFEEIIQIIEHNRSFVDFGEFGNGVSDVWITKAENRLGLYFPESYKWWLRNYSGGSIQGNEIYSIYEIDFDTVVGGDIVYMNEINRKNGTANVDQLVIQENDFGEMYFFKLNEQHDNGEYPIYLDITGEIYATDFLDFLKKKIYGEIEISD